MIGDEDRWMERDRHLCADHGNNVLAVLCVPPPAGKLCASPACGRLCGEMLSLGGRPLKCPRK